MTIEGLAADDSYPMQRAGIQEDTVCVRCCVPMVVIGEDKSERPDVARDHIERIEGEIRGRGATQWYDVR